MDAKNTCDGRRNDRSHMDYKGADDVQDAFSIVSVHDRFLIHALIIADAIDPEGSLFSHAVLPGPLIDGRYFRLTFPDGGKGKDLLA